jgi:Membrane-associated apoptosis protein
MIAVLTSNLKQLIHEGKPTLESLNAQKDEAQMREAAKRMDLAQFLTVTTTIGFIQSFRALLSKSFTNLYESKFPSVVSLVRQLRSSATSEETRNHTQTIANQIGITDVTDGVLEWALSGVIGILIVKFD